VRFNENTARPVSLAVDPESHRVFVGLFGSQVGPKGENLAVVDVFGSDVVVPDVETKGPFDLQLETDGSGGHSWGILATGTVNPDNAGEVSCWFVWGMLRQALSRESPCEDAVPNGGKAVPVDASLSDLAPDTTYYYRLQARNEHGVNLGEESQDYEFTTPGPGLESESVSGVSSSSAKLEATIVPHDAPEAGREHDLQGTTSSPTTYYFQYSREPTEGCVSAPSACVNVPLAPASTGTGAVGVEVEEDLSKLTPSTTYHYRVVTMNEALPTVVPGVIPTAEPGVQIAFYGPDRAFKTQGPGRPSAPPDGRVWELVSPEDKHGAKVEGWAQAAIGGGELTFLTGTPSTSLTSGYDGNGNQVLASRVAPGMWSSLDIALSHSKPTGVFANVLPEYRFFSEDFSLAIVESLGPFSVPEGRHENRHGEWEKIVESFPVPIERTPYLRHDTTCATNWSTCYEPLLYAEDTLGGEPHEGDQKANESAAKFVGATPDASHAVISSSVRLTGTPVAGSGPWLYEWSPSEPAAQRLSLVNILPVTEKLRGALFEGISTDGSLVFFTNTGPIKRELQVRDVPKGETVRLDVTEDGLPAEKELSFWGASAGGSNAFFTDNAQLREDAGTTGSDLYVCEMGAAPLKCALQDLTPVPAAGRPGANENARVSRVLDVSPDGGYVYFVAKGVQADGAAPGDENVYVAHEQGGVWSTSFIASSPQGDAAGAVSPDGRWLAFSSEASLTGYDNRDVKTGLPDSEVYLYDAQSEKLACVSCNPTGARPVGPADVPSQGRPMGAGENTFAHPFNAGAVRSLFDGGRLFFDSGDALVPQDTNDNVDVYEFEPPGVGDCSPMGVTFHAGSGGCVGLISSGVAFGRSVFLEASGTGGDVFFTTAERLVPKDVDTAVDVYDAHECTPGSPCASPDGTREECGSAASCRAAPSPQPSLYGAPSSSTFSGAGNLTPGLSEKAKPTVEEVRRKKLKKALKACRKLRRRSGRVACEHKARARYAVRSSKSGMRRSAVTPRSGKRG
jgi:WD40-like Beta Propeller Repeat